MQQRNRSDRMTHKNNLITHKVAQQKDNGKQLPEIQVCEAQEEPKSLWASNVFTCKSAGELRYDQQLSVSTEESQ